MNAKRTSGWLYFLLSISITTLALLSRDPGIRIEKLLYFSVPAGYLLGALLYSFSGFFTHAYKWTFNVRNYRYHYITTRKRRRLFRLRLTPKFSKRRRRFA